MRRVILESPYAGDIEANVAYARAAMRDSLKRGEYPIASHLLYTQPGVLNDDDPKERQWGIDAGLAWKAVAHGSVVYTDLGTSNGMRQGIEPEELVFRYFDSFFEQGVPTDLQEIRWKHYEKKRLEKLAQVRQCVRKEIESKDRARPGQRRG